MPAIMLTALFHASPLGITLDRGFFDAASRRPFRRPAEPPPSALVLIDEQTLAAMSARGHRWPFPRRIFSQLTSALYQAGATKIILDLTFFEESESAEEDYRLGSLAAAAGNVILGGTADRQPVFWDEGFRRENASLFAHTRVGSVDFRPDDDGIVRHYAMSGSLAGAAIENSRGTEPRLLRWHGGIHKLRASGIPILSALPYIEHGRPIFDHIAQHAGDMAPESMAAALQSAPALPESLAEKIRGRVVFVGTNASATYDLKVLPVGKVEPGVLIHWTAWATAATDNFIRSIPRWVVLLAAFPLGLIVVVAGVRGHGLGAPALAAGLAAGSVFVGSYTALSGNWWFGPSTPAFAIFLTLLGVAAERFWREQARKREIQSMFGAYVDPSIVARLVRDPDSIRLGGEKRVATCFFSDLAGFTDLSEKLADQPQRMVEIVNAYLDETSECLLNHGAYVDKYIGDAVMAVFGAPQTLENHALSAARAALEAARSLDGINARYATEAGVRLAVRIGLNTGDMIVGNVGSSRKKNYTVMGDAVNLASRLEAANKHFGTTILMGSETARQIESVMAVRPLARLRVKGKLEAVEVFTLHGENTQLPEAERQFLAHYRLGYDAYSEGRFAEAAVELRRAESTRPNDKWTLYLRQRAEQLLASPPGPEWDPAITLDSK